MHILIADLHEYASRIRQQIPRHSQSVPQVRKIAVYAVSPRVAECLHLFGLTGYLARVTVLHVAARRAPLEVAVEFYAVWRVDVYALNFAAEALAFGEARHHMEAVAQDHPVAPVLVVRVKFSLVGAVRNAVEVAEEIELVIWRVTLVLLCLTPEIVYQNLRVYLLLYIERRRGDDEVAPVQFILASPDKLGVEIAVARGFFIIEGGGGAFIGHRHRGRLAALQ